MGPQGFEHTPLAAPKTPISETLRTESGTLSARNSAQTDPDLRQIIDAWHSLPDRVKREIRDTVQPYAKTPDAAARRVAVLDSLRQAHDDDQRNCEPKGGTL